MLLMFVALSAVQTPERIAQIGSCAGTELSSENRDLLWTAFKAGADIAQELADAVGLRIRACSEMSAEDMLSEEQASRLSRSTIFHVAELEGRRELNALGIDVRVIEGWFAGLDEAKKVEVPVATEQMADIFYGLRDAGVSHAQIERYPAQIARFVAVLIQMELFRRGNFDPPPQPEQG